MGQASVNEFPAFRWFPMDSSAEPEVYEGPATAKALGNWVNQLMPNNVRVLQDARGMREWLESVAVVGIPAIVLFTDKRSAPPLWKSLGREFENRTMLGVVPGCDKNGVFKTVLQKEYDVRIPQVVALDPMAPIGKIADKFDSQMKHDILTLWFRKLTLTKKKAGPAASFVKWTAERLEGGDCAPTDSQFCFLWLKAGAEPQVEAAMKELAVKYRTDPIKVMYVSTELSPGILDSFGLGGGGDEVGDAFVAYRPKRGKYKVHEGEMSFRALDSFVDGVMNGGPLTQKLSAHVEL